MKLFRSNNIRNKLLTWFLFISIIPLITLLFITYLQRVKYIEESAYTKLSTIRDLKVQQLNNWFEERTGDIQVHSNDVELKSLEFVFTKNNRSIQEDKLIASVNETFIRILKNYAEYSEVFFIDANTGLVKISTTHENINFNESKRTYFKKPIETGEVFISSVYRTLTSDSHEIAFSSPVYCLSHNSHIIGVLVFKIDLKRSLYKLLDYRTGLGKTGETLIVNEEHYAINELRWYQDTPLNLKINALPALKAAQGETGMINALDYRGVKVLAAFTHFDRIGWGFVAKQDMSEIKEPVRQMVWDFLLLFSLSIIGISLAAVYISKTFSKPIIAMNHVAQEIANGDLSARNIVDVNDEIGSLALEFNRMATSLESKIRHQQGVSDISVTMISKSNLEDFGIALLKRLMHITKANMSSFYVFNEKSRDFTPLVSLGANHEMLKSVSLEKPEGEFGMAISEKNIYHLKNIPKDTRFKFKTIAGDIIPREIISIPVLVENEVLALISLVSIKNFKFENIEVLKHSWININVAFSNLVVNERTKMLAENLTKMNQQLEAQSEELQDQAEELQDQASELQNNADELQKQNIELEAQRNQVEAANKLKSEFLSNMSHELRTPLNSIMALSRVLILQAGKKLNEEENNYLEIVERNGKRLLTLINDILDLSKVEAGKMEITPGLFSVGSLLQLLKENMQSLAESKGIKLNLEMTDNIPDIESDESRLHQVLTNVIGNAVKFTEKGSVSISASHSSNNVLIKVRDTGIGISKEDIPYIFDEFRQADGSSSRQYEGTGLGLSIAKKILKLLGGQIEVESEEGRGSVFTVIIPVKWTSKILSQSLIEYEKPFSGTESDTILVVDDNPKTVKIIADYLHEAGYKVITASTGKEALLLADQYHPFAITLNIIMQDMDGWETLQKLKSKISTKDIPVIMISVSNDNQTGLALGASGFINKPVNKQTLISQIREINMLPERIMIVDDNEFELDQLSKMIETEQIKTIKAHGGRECLELLEKEIPDLLILDLMMPDIDGFKVLERLKEKPETLNLPVIILTAKDLSREEKENLSRNVALLTSKSEINSNRLLKEIKRIIQELEKNKLKKALSKTDSKVRLLLVEDNQDAIIQVKSVLEKSYYQVEVATGGKEALEYMVNTIPDGIILDLMMPDVDGFDVLEKIRSTDITKNIPVLILTAKDLTKTDLEKLSANNVQQLVQKGDIDIDGLLKKISQMISKDTRQRKEEKAALPISGIPSKPGISRKKSGKARLLVIEDNPDNMITIKAILKNNYSIIEAVNGEDGLKLAESQGPDLILLDMSLPQMSGEQVIALLKRNPDTKDIPVIAVTAQAMKGDEDKFKSMGCDAYISKPINSGDLLEKIDFLLNQLAK